MPTDHRYSKLVILADNLKAQIIDFANAVGDFNTLPLRVLRTGSSTFTMANAQNIVAAAAAVAAALAAQAATDANDMDGMAAATEVVTQTVLNCSQLNLPPARFALTPAIAVTGVVDFKTPEGQKSSKPQRASWMTNRLTVAPTVCTNSSSLSPQEPKDLDGPKTQEGS